MPIKICFVTNYAYRLFNEKSRITFGGIETIFYLMAEDLAVDKRFAVSFLLEDDVHQLSKSETIKKITLYKTSRQNQSTTFHDPQIVKYNRWFRYWAGKFDRLWQLPHLDFFRLWERLKQINADVYVFASPGYESGLLTIICKIIKKKSIFILVNDEILANKALFFILKHADLVMCFSRRHQKILRKKFGIKATFLPPWYPRPGEIFSRNKRQYYLWVGRIESRKQPQVFIRLARCLPDLKFLMILAVSPREPKLFAATIRQVVRLPNLQLRRDVIFTDLEQYYQRALALVDTSNYKNLNMSQVQAAFMGVPGISFGYDPNNSYKKYHWGLSAAGNFSRLRKNTRQLLITPKLWSELSINACRFADSVYSRKTNLTEFKVIIEKLCKKLTRC